jgi:hypothetical protein
MLTCYLAMKFALLLHFPTDLPTIQILVAHQKIVGISNWNTDILHEIFKISVASCVTVWTFQCEYVIHGFNSFTLNILWCIFCIFLFELSPFQRMFLNCRFFAPCFIFIVFYVYVKYVYKNILLFEFSLIKYVHILCKKCFHEICKKSVQIVYLLVDVSTTCWKSLTNIIT